jgi:hypothetical protein
MQTKDESLGNGFHQHRLDSRGNPPLCCIHTPKMQASETHIRMQIKRVSDGGDDGDSYMHDILISNANKTSERWW